VPTEQRQKLVKGVGRGEGAMADLEARAKSAEITGVLDLGSFGLKVRDPPTSGLCALCAVVRVSVCPCVSYVRTTPHHSSRFTER
jgi:hypothetical protein